MIRISVSSPLRRMTVTLGQSGQIVATTKMIMAAVTGAKPT